MTTFVVGASGATGRLVVKQLLKHGGEVKVIVRSAERFTSMVQPQDNLTVIEASLLELTSEVLAQHVQGCEAIISCLGHNITLKGIWGSPSKLVKDAVAILTQAVTHNVPNVKVRFILMNTTGNPNKDLNEKIPTLHKVILSIIRLLIPPQRDNEAAANLLRTEIGQDHPYLEWLAVRPDSLIDEEKVTEYEVYPSPIRSAILNPGKTSRINVANFMSELVGDSDLWVKWQGQMPVVYNIG